MYTNHLKEKIQALEARERQEMIDYLAAKVLKRSRVTQDVIVVSIK